MSQQPAVRAGLPTGSDEEIEAAVAQIKEQGVSQVRL